MTTVEDAMLPHDADAVRFEVRNGMHRVGCTVSGEALEAASGLVVPSTTGMRRQSFDRFRTVIHAAAMRKLGTLPPNFAGLLAVTSDDLRGQPPMTGEPVFGNARRTQ